MVLVLLSVKDDFFYRNYGNVGNYIKGLLILSKSILVGSYSF